MATSEIEQLWISQFQENLGALRKVAGWTTQQLANELGVARQTISNLETGRSPMTKLQYLALRTVFSAEIAECGNRELAKIIKTLVDDPIELRIKELGTADNTKANSATEPDAPSEADDARPVAPASKPAAGRRACRHLPSSPRLSPAAPPPAFSPICCFPTASPAKTADVDRADRTAERNKADHRQSY